MTPNGTTYQITKPHDPTYQKQSISPHRFQQGFSNIVRPQEGTRGYMQPSAPKPDSRQVENINIELMDTKQSDEDVGSIYLP